MGKHNVPPEKKGFPGYLKPEQTQALELMRRRLKVRSVQEPETPGLQSDIGLLSEAFFASVEFKEDKLKIPVWFDVQDDHDVCRYLRARKFDVDAAYKMFVEMLVWRRDFGADHLIDTFHFAEKEALLRVSHLGTRALRVPCQQGVSTNVARSRQDGQTNLHRTARKDEVEGSTSCDHPGPPPEVSRSGKACRFDKRPILHRLPSVHLLHAISYTTSLSSPLQEWEKKLCLCMPIISKIQGTKVYQTLTVLDLKGVVRVSHGVACRRESVLTLASCRQ
eukprot:scaffold1504_cov417-Prasinococcus_capsulatus_cf.AAC.28